jgi:predicted Zn finger-like uncharacterized protein
MNSVIELNCPSCRSTLMVSLVLEGKEVRCPKCETVFIPKAGPAGAAEALGSPTRDQPVFATDARVGSEIGHSSRPQEHRIGFRCPFCQSAYPPAIKRRISTAGWVIFAVLLIACFPLSIIGLFVKEDYRVCSSCGITLG